jgi:exodeoxyribonuclease VII large subunit
MIPLRLQEVLSTVQTYFDRQFRGKVFWCQAEIMAIKSVKWRVYIDLVEYDQSWVLVAKMKGIIREEELLAVYLNAHGLIQPEELIGQSIMFQAECTFHTQRWLSLRIEALSHEFTRGKQLENKDTIRKKLKETWIFDHNSKTTFGLPPLRLAVISAPQAEWLRDFTAIIEQSHWNVAIDLFPATMHGEPAKKEVADQLASIYDRYQEYTAVIITRGWWWGEWLARQNDQTIAEAICKMKIPVILATWHTNDTSILDEIVRHAAKTPSDAAHLIIDGLEQTAWRIETLFVWIQQKWTARFEEVGDEVAFFRSQIRLASMRQKNRLDERVDAWRSAIQLIDPLRQTTRGYALIRDDSGAYITKKTIDELKQWDHLSVLLYWKTFGVVVKEIEKK